jgi:uncharacterized tellurite resistance protein B-like protein
MSDTIKTTKLKGTELIVETSDGVEVYDSKFLVAALHFKMQGSESLELLTRAMSELAEKPDLAEHLVELGQTLSDQEKEDIAVMALKVIAADGRREFAEMENFNRAVEAVGVSPEIVHRAFDRYFAETMPGNS